MTTLVIPAIVEERLALPLPRMTRERWEAAWAEQNPGYRPEPLYRVDGEWQSNDGMLPRLLADFHLALAERYFVAARVICEIGCGLGQNLVRLAKLWPDREYIGLDWAESALSKLQAQLPSARTVRFDMFSPSYDLPLGAAVLTACALEQVGQWQAILDWLVNSKASVIVHVEPLYELYGHNPFDQIAVRWHDKRGYFKGYLPALREMERQGCIEILECSRTRFGGMMHDGYSVLAWRPR